MGTETKFIYSGLTGAPTMNNAAGQLIGVLDAVLVNGFGSTNITGGTLTGTTATLTMASAGSFDVDTVVEIAGATPSGLNGQWRVTSKTSTSITFACTVTAGGVSAAGTVKVAALGWTKVYSGTNLAAYKSSDPTSTGMFFRVDDTFANDARALGYEAMTDITTGTGQFPLGTQQLGYAPIGKSSSAANRDWFVIGDTKMFYIGTAVANTAQQFVISYFGDFIPYRSGDAYACIISASSAAVHNSTSQQPQCAGTTRVSASYAPRVYHGLGTSVSVTRYGVLSRVLVATYSGTPNANYDLITTFPNPCDNGVILCKVQCADGVSGFRGEMPGLLHTPQNMSTTYPSYTKFDGTGQFAGKRLIAFRVGRPDGTFTGSEAGTCFFDLHGNWRT